MLGKKFASAAALLGLVSSQLAYAQETAAPCVEQQDLADAVVFTLPVAYSAFMEKCGAELASDGFVAREGDAFVAQYADLQEETWPGAYSFFKVFASKTAENDEMSTMFDSLPSELLRPFFELLIQAELTKNIKVKDCGKIERVIEPLAPLPPQNLGTLFATIFDIMPDVDNPKICPTEAK